MTATTKRTRRPRGSLTLDQIVDAALAVLDEQGLEGLTMAAVAARLGVGAMSLYAHVSSKAELLQAVFARRMADRGLPERQAGQAWDEWVLAAHQHLRSASLAQPALAREIAELFMANAGKGPVAIGPGSQILEALVEAGMTDEDASRAFVTINCFHVGFLLWEIPRFHLQSTDDYRRDYLRRLAETPEPPTSATWAMLGVLTDQPVDTLYEDGMRTVIAGVAARFL